MKFKYAKNFDLTKRGPALLTNISAVFKARMSYFKFNIAAAAITLVASGNCLAQLGGEAPLPEIKKPTGPSLEETTQWITAKIASFPIFEYGDSRLRYQYVVSFDNCEMTAFETISTETIFTYRYTPELNISSLHLQDMDADNIEVGPGSFALNSLGELKVVRILQLDNVTLDDKRIIDRLFVKGEEVKTIPGQWYKFEGKEIGVVKDLKSYVNFDFSYKDIETSERMSNAFKHAVMLCQKKAADEKAARPAKPKELF